MSGTQVMASIADVRCTADFVADLYRLGMKAVRINSAHISPDTFREMVSVIRSVSPDIKILMDTKGAEIRTTALPRALCVEKGMRLEFRSGDEDSTNGCIRLKVADIAAYVHPGDEMLIDDGLLRFRITEVNADSFIAEALNSGELGSRKTVAFPGITLPPLPAVTERDRMFIELSVELGIDMIAHSFVRSASDVLAVKALTQGSSLQIYAKIECPEAVENMEEIAAAADGLLVARGDLSTCVAYYAIPEVQLRASASCRKLGKPLILATQILNSMMEHPYPTRPEADGIALAVLEGFNWLLLTGETAAGKYPRECVDVLHRTICSVSSLPWKLSTNI